MGSVGPAAMDMCTFGNDDMCTGMPVGTAGNTQCQCGGFTMPNPPNAGLPNVAAYTDNGDGSVIDNITGLVWEKSPSATACSGSGTCTQLQAASYCAAKNAGWRLPTRLELVSLIDFTIAPPGPTINQTFFPGTSSSEYYWTSTPYTPSPDTVWAVNFTNSYVGNLGTSSLGRVRCVH